MGNPARAPRGSSSSLKPSLTPFPARPSYLPIDSGRALADWLASCFGNLLASPSPLVSMPFRVAPLSFHGPGTSKPCQTMPNASPISPPFELRVALVVCKHSCCCCCCCCFFIFNFLFPFMLQNISWFLSSWAKLSYFLSWSEVDGSFCTSNRTIPPCTLQTRCSTRSLGKSWLM